MPTEATETTSQPKRPQKTVDRAPRPKATAEARRTPKIVAPPPAPQAGTRRTKQKKMLALLNRPDGATVSDLMEATGWQQHSVRGFLAGTVKKKLRLALTSAKDDGGLRRYRIVAKRGR